MRSNNPQYFTCPGPDALLFVHRNLPLVQVSSRGSIHFKGEKENEIDQRNRTQTLALRDLWEEDQAGQPVPALACRGHGTKGTRGLRTTHEDSSHEEGSEESCEKEGHEKEGSYEGR